MYQVRIAARAEADVDDALRWLRQYSSTAADRWYAGLLKAVQSLEEYPRRCGLAPEAEDLNIELRQLLFGKRQRTYRILFIVEGDTVNVLHVRHCARTPLRPGDLP